MPKLLKKEKQSETQNLLDQGSETAQSQFLKDLIAAVTKLLEGAVPQSE